MTQQHSTTYLTRASDAPRRRFKAIRTSAVAIALALTLSSLTACGIPDLIRPDPTISEETTSAPEPQPTKLETTQTEESTSIDPTTEQTTTGQADQKQLFDEAVITYSEFQKQELALMVQGKSPRMPAWLSKYTTGEYLSILVAQIMNLNTAENRLADDTAAKTKIDMRPYLAPDNAEAEVALEVCLDMRKADVVQKSTGKPVRKGVLAHRRVFMKRDNGSLKIFEGETKNVSKCPFRT